MTFDDLVVGDRVFVDANIFIYHFSPDPAFGASCTQLLKRIENQEIAAFTSTAILSEVAHRLMTTEARTRFAWSSGKVVSRLKQDLSRVQTLTVFRRAIEAVSQSQIQVLTIAPSLVVPAVADCQGIGLLINDALSVAVMQANGLTKIASHDADFDRVPGLTRYGPV